MSENVKKWDNAFFRQFMFLVVLVGIGFVIFRELHFFVGAFLGAITIYVVTRNLMFYLVEKCHIRKWIAALLIVAVVGAIFALFLGLLVRTIGASLPSFSIRDLLTGINHLFDNINTRAGFQLISDSKIHESDALIMRVLGSILNTTYSFAINIFMMLIVLYFMLTGGRRMEASALKYMPFHERSLALIKREVTTMIHSNAVGIPLIMIVQTLLSALIYWLIGFPNYWLWGFLTGICGLLPIMGTAFVYLPISIYLIAMGSTINGIVLLAYGLVIISNADNAFRIILLKKVADTHPMIVIFGVIMGIPLFGFWGIIFGPLLLSGFILLIRIYYMEYGLLDHPSDEELHQKKPRKLVPRHFRKFAPKEDKKEDKETDI
ncbi:MAG: AI-2E family transporter [Rikenellaceae bacterium]|nr:AI-2E family transporter [Rikenellaceae bacterium]MCL2692997.1 AI-2E family transporter [Rikenellaceae bacterium]